MRNPLLYSCTIAILSGCFVDIHGEKWPDDWEDTGDPTELADEEVDDSPEYIITPDLLEPGINEVLTVEAEEEIDWTLLVGVTSIGDLTIVDYKAIDDLLYVGIIVADAALDGPAHLILEFSDGQVHFVRDAVTITDLEEEIEGDTGLVDEEPTDD